MHPRDHDVELDADDEYPLQEQRLDLVTRLLVRSGARSVIDLGCGEGDLLLRLADEPSLDRIVGVDIHAPSLAIAERRLAPWSDTRRFTLRRASFAEPDPELAGIDAATLVETIEHIDPGRLSPVERAVFGVLRPPTVVVTTPNCEYNVHYGLAPGEFRHPDHRFEWTRARFQQWATGIARRNGYRVTFLGVGLADPHRGPPTQLAHFTQA